MKGIDAAGVRFSIQNETNTKAEGMTSWSNELLMGKLHSDSDCSLAYANTSACVRVTKENGNLCLICM